MIISKRLSSFFFFSAFFLAAAGPVQQEGDPQFLTGAKTGRGFITHKLQSAPGGAILTVEVVQDRLKSPVKLLLALSGAAHTPGTPNWVLTSGAPNPSGYRTRFEFYLDYAALAKSAESQVANARARIAGGQSMVVIAEFAGGHRWGGTDRSGLFQLPQPGARQARQVAAVESPALPAFGEGPPATSLDVGQPIDAALAEQFAPLAGRGGLEVGGQIRSRVEAEGKFQLDEAEFHTIRTRLFELANNPRLAKTVFGSEWTLEVVTRYMKKNRTTGALVLDKDGYPIPDPMVDTYYDTANMDAAKNDIAIRYRWTAGNKTGTWNFKPGLGRVSKDGIVYRVEYGVDAVDNRPESIEVFANSYHPLNPFQLLREIVPGTTPGRFFGPSIKLTDDRYKFALKHKTGIIIEVSLDRVLAQRLVKNTEAEVTFFQLEMDIEHIATEVAATGAEPGVVGGASSAYATLHTPADVGVNSATLETQATTFALSAEVIKKLRDDVAGKKWRPGAQKYAFAAAALKAIRPASASRSVAALGFAKHKCAHLLAEPK